MKKKCLNCGNEYDEDSSNIFCADCENFERLRASLMQTYNYQTITHGGYVIALILGSITLLSKWKDFSEYLLILYFLISLLIGVGTYLSGRTVFWAFISSYALKVKLSDLIPIKSNETIISKFQDYLLKNFTSQSSLPIKSYVGNKASWKKRISLILAVFGLCFIVLLLSSEIIHSLSSAT